MLVSYSYPPLSKGGWWVQRLSYPRWICCTWKCLVRKSPHDLITTINRVFQGNYARQRGLSGAFWVQTRTILEEWKTESRCPWTYRRFRVWSSVSHRFFEEARYHHIYAHPPNCRWEKYWTQVMLIMNMSFQYLSWKTHGSFVSISEHCNCVVCI